MLKRGLCFAFLLIASYSFAQNDTTKYFNSVDYGWRYKRVKIDSGFILPKDTIRNKLGLANVNNSLFVGNGTKWVGVANTSSGTVTSVALTTPTGLQVSGSPITNAGTFGITYTSGYSLPTTASQSLWDNAYTNRITTANAPLFIASNTIRVDTTTRTTGLATLGKVYNDSLVLATAIATKASGTVTSVARTNGLGISASIANPTTTPNITIAVDTSDASVLSRQRAATTYTAGAIDSIRFNNSGILHTTPAAYSKSGTTGVVTQTLANQSAYTLFGRASGTGTPSFLTSIDSLFVPALHTENYYNTKYLTPTTAATTYYPLTGGNLTAGASIGYPKIVYPSTPASGFVTMGFNTSNNFFYKNENGYLRIHKHQFNGDDSVYYPNKARVILKDSAENAAVYQTQSLSANYIWIGNSSAVAVEKQVSGDATLNNTGALTLASVNNNVGGFGSGAKTTKITVNAKGLITAASDTLIQIPESQVTGLTADLATKEPTIALNGTANKYMTGYKTWGSFLDTVNKQLNTYTGDVTFNNGTSTIGTSKVTNSMLAGSIDSTKIPILHSKNYYDSFYAAGARTSANVATSVYYSASNSFITYWNGLHSVTSDSSLKYNPTTKTITVESYNGAGGGVIRLAGNNGGAGNQSGSIDFYENLYRKAVVAQITCTRPSGGAQGQINLITEGTNRIFINESGQIGFGNNTSPTAKIHPAAGTASANSAPFKFTSGVASQTTKEAGAVNYDGSNITISDATYAYILTKTLTATATLDFTSTSAQNSSDLTITVTGATDGDVVNIGVPNGSTLTNSSYSAWVSAANTVTVRFNNYSSGSQDPASGTFRVSVIKY